MITFSQPRITSDFQSELLKYQEKFGRDLNRQIEDVIFKKCREMLEVLNLGKKELKHYDIAKESKHSDIAVNIVDIKECNCKKEEYEVEDK